MLLQQCLPFTVLKRVTSTTRRDFICVATVLTVYGIETLSIGEHGKIYNNKLQQCLPFTVLKLCTLSFVTL